MEASGRKVKGIHLNQGSGFGLWLSVKGLGLGLSGYGEGLVEGYESRF